MLSSSKKKKSCTEITLVSIKVEEIDQISFFFLLSLFLLSSSSLLIFFSFSCFPTMPFSRFFATFFSSLLVTVGFLPRRKSFTSSSILLHFFSSLLVTRKFFPQTLECIFVFQFVAIHVKSRPAYTRIQRETFTFLQILLHPFFYFLLQETFSLYIATFIFTSLYDCEAFILT